jgi:methyl-accepting chemotaxis protein
MRTIATSPRSTGGAGRASLRRRLITVGGATTIAITAAVAGIGLFQAAKNETVATETTREIALASLDKVVEGVVAALRTQQDALEGKVRSDLALALDVVRQSGGVTLGTETDEWTARNQLDQRTTTVRLRRMRIGERPLVPGGTPSGEQPVVDRVHALSGSACTLFQRINDSGDMLRVVTTVRDREGRRAAGTYIPAVNPDGSPNPLIARVLAGETYVGSAFVVDRLYVTAYAPLRDDAGRVMGMAFVGVPQEPTAALRRTIGEIRVGSTGYVYVLDPQGRYLISKDGKRDGENIWGAKDARGELFIQDIVRRALSLRPGETARAHYPWQNPGDPAPREKTVAVGYFAPWRWIVAAGTWDDEFFAGIRAIEAANRDSRTLTLVVLGLSALLVPAMWFFIARGFARRIAATAESISGGAERIAAATCQVSAASRALAEGAGEQASSLAEISESITGLGGMTRRNAEHAGAGMVAAERARQAAESGAAEMERLNAAISGIQHSSRDIEGILKTIDEIAFQTNILALNAAVEAARAGDAGAGFAVVADEVRGLARRSAQAAQETSFKITEATQRSDQGVALSGRVSATFREIVGRTQEVDKLVSEIATASGQQEKGLEEIGTAIGRMDAVTRANAAGSEESATAAGELDARAAGLRFDAAELVSIVYGTEARPAESAPSPAAAEPGDRGPAGARRGGGSNPVASLPRT